MSSIEQRDDGVIVCDDSPKDEFSWPPLESNPDVFTVREIIKYFTSLSTSFFLR
jgi:hypothetical protein